MDDCISRQAAIDKFEPWLKVKGYSEGELNMLKAVLYELRFLPSAQPEPIKINIDHELTKEEYEKLRKDLADAPIVLMPSAQPEIIRCKDCKNSEHWYRDRRRCFLWSEDGVSVFDDGFCNYAERRTDD